MKSKKELVAQRDPKSPVSEVFRTLRTNIQFMSTNKQLRTLLITSTFPGEGKSWVSSNLAVTFAQAGNKVVLIDADMRKGRQFTIFGAAPRPGLSNYLSGIDSNNGGTPDLSRYLQQTDVENLLLMAAGNMPPNPSELLVSPQMAKLLDELKEVCDIVIIDGTPCELVTDAVILSRIVDSTVVVTAYKATKKDNLERVLKNIKNVGGNLSGVVLNKIPIDIKKYTDRYYYYGTPPVQSDKNNQNRNQVKNEQKNHNNNNVNSKKQHNNENYKSYKFNNNTNMNHNTKMNTNFNRINENVNNEINNNMGNIEKIDAGEFKDMTDLNNSINPEMNLKNTVNNTAKILDQINSYLDSEKKNLN